MGFRSTFITGYIRTEMPDWFIEKYHDHINFGHCLSSKREEKMSLWKNLPGDLQKIIDWDRYNLPNFILVYLHECGGVTRVQIEKDSIYFAEPNSWDMVDNVTHHYCYHCSDVKNILTKENK